MTTEDTLARLRALLADATPGPWSFAALPGDPGVVSGDTVVAACPEGYDERPQAEADARLIVAAVNALPALLDVVEAARKENAVAMDAVERLQTLARANANGFILTHDVVVAITELAYMLRPLAESLAALSRLNTATEDQPHLPSPSVDCPLCGGPCKEGMTT